MARSSVADRFTIEAPDGEPVECTVVRSAQGSALPVVAFLYGGGGSAQTLLEMRPLLERWWTAAELPPMLLACAEVGSMSFYLDDPDEGTYGESIVADRLLGAVRERFDVSSEPAATGLLGISMGGYGALKIALARPGAFGAVAAVQPMLEPARYADQAPLRSRFHYPPDVPSRLLGEDRDPELFERDSPITRAMDNAAALRDHGPAIYLEAGDRDLLNAHDGAELLHRVLWSLDIGHEYHLVHEADHGGPTLVPRLLEAARWLGRRLCPPEPLGMSPDEQAWVAYLDAGMPGEPPPAISPQSPVFLRWLRAVLEPAREAAARRDPTVKRRYGRLPSLDELGPSDDESSEM